jgi:hypothetical protein
MHDINPFDRMPVPIKTIPCPDCIQRPGCNFYSPNPEIPEPCPSCAGYGNILHPDEVERTRVDQQKMRKQGAYDLERRTMGRLDRMRNRGRNMLRAGGPHDDSKASGGHYCDAG